MNKPKVILLAIALLVMVLSLTASAHDGKNSVKHKQNGVFVLTADKEFRGATVEILSSKGVVIAASKMSGRKIIIDFQKAEHGAYIVRLTKGDSMETFDYQNI